MFLLLTLLLLYQHPIKAKSEKEADKTSGACVPRKCEYTEWTLWTQCSHECGKNGTRNRTRRMLSDNGCNGTCKEAVRELEKCNIRCCPQNCEYSEWNRWSCTCSADECEKVGHRFICLRSRNKVKQESCGGYCANFVLHEKCGNPCCYKDCILGSWAPWTECQAPCEKPGLKYRNKTVTQEPKCGGRRCKQKPEQAACRGKCCPVDCVVGAWSDWPPCPTTCGTATLTRTRPLQRGKCGGKVCTDSKAVETKKCESYVNVSCKVSPWSGWSDCKLDNGKCGPGSHMRTRTVLVNPQCKGTKCPPLKEESKCNGDCCVTDCVVSDWSKFGHCSTSCGKGKRNSTRKVITAQACGGKPCPELVRYEPCTEQEMTNCKFTSWSKWSRCDNGCGKGNKTRTRTLVTPAYCGGTCPSLHTVERRECESFRARKNCKMGEWGPWSTCERNCERGRKSRSRVILTNDTCGGQSCSSFNLTETSPCHAPCQQLCNQGVCSCRPGHVLQADKVTCHKRTCTGKPNPRYCGPGTINFKSCLHVEFVCPSETKFESRCNATCFKRNWVVKGGKPYVTCQANGQWDSRKIFCGPKNKAPVNISVSNQKVSERSECFAELKTTADNEPWDKHTYSIVHDESSNIKVNVDHLCCIKPFDFETTRMRSWKTTVRSTDLDGLYVDRQFTFSLLNANDPPRSVTLKPNTVRENSHKGTEVGCLEATDDDPGQSFSFFIVKSIDKLFELFQDQQNKTCVRVSRESDPRCYKEGGTWCLLNHEKTSAYYLTIMVRDNGTKPQAAYFDVRIGVEDVNEPITDIKLKPPAVPESVPPGKPLVQLKAKDEDKGQKYTFRLVADSSGLFSVNGQSLKASQSFDYEKDPNRQFVITLEVSDDGQPPMKARKEMAFRIGDRNESPYNLQMTGTDSSVKGQFVLRENMPGTMIGTVSVHDPDAGDSVNLTVSDPRFGLQNKRCAPLKDNVYNYCSAQLVCTKGVDFELTPVINLTIKAEDSKSNYTQKQFVLKVLDQNDPPTDIQVNGKNSSEIKVKENQPDTRVGDIRVVDEDKGDTHTIFLSGSASSHFRVDKGQLRTTAASSLDYERQGSSLRLVMTAVDGGRPGQTVMKTFTIVLVDVNEAPTAVKLSKTEVTENSPGGTVVGTLTTLDPDNQGTPHQNFTYHLKDNANGRFRVHGDKLMVTELAQHCFSARCSLNHEKQPDVLVKIEATDSGLPPLSVVTPVTISVKNANDAPTNIRLSKNTVRENRPLGMLVGSIMADDEDVQDTVTFTLPNGSDVFSIENKDKLVTRRKLDYEQIQSVKLAIRASDNGQPPASTVSVITVVIEDEPEPPRFTSPAAMSAMENEPTGSVVGSLMVTDPDRGDHLDIVLHEPTKSFALGHPVCSNSTGSGVTCNVTLMTSAVLEFETKNKYEVDVTARDRKGHTVVKVITVNVKDTNDPPKDVLVNGMSVKEVRVAEGREGKEWRLRVVEEDVGQQHTLSISSQSGNHLTLKGNVLKVTRAYDYEKEAQSSVEVKVVDSGRPPQTLLKTLRVLVEDVNEAPSSLTLSANKVSENSVGGTVVGHMVAVDPDGDKSLTFFLQDDAGRRFEIDGNKLVVKDNGKCGGNAQQACRLNYEKNTTHTVKVMVTDSGAPPKHATFDLDIEVKDANDPPHDIRLSSNRIAKAAAAGTRVGKLTVMDEDAKQTHTFTLLNDANGKFKVTSGSAVTKATDERLDARQVYSIEVKATDSGSPPREVKKTFYLSVSGVRGAPSIPTVAVKDPAVVVPGASSTLKVPENVNVSSVLATLASVDKGPDSTLTFTLLEDGDGHFALGKDADCKKKGGNTECSVSLTVKSPLDFETRRSFPLLVKVMDAQGMQAVLPFAVVITDVNEPPLSITFMTREIKTEENAGGLSLGTFIVGDPDDGDTATFVLTRDSGAKFTITPSGLLATAAGPGLDYEKMASHSLGVKVTDSAGNTLSRDFNVTVVNVNERPSSLSLQPNSSVVEMSPAGTLIGQLVVKDPDNEGVQGRVQNFTFTLMSDNDGRFQIDGDKLKVKEMGVKCTIVGGTSCLLDHESKASQQVVVTVTDSGTPSISVPFVLQVVVRDANDQPSPPLLDRLSVSEAMKIGLVIGDLSSLDQDRNQTVRYDLVGESASFFSVNGSRLLLAHALDYERQTKVKVTIRVTDNGQPPLSNEDTFTISVDNVNEAPTEMTMVPKQGGAGVAFAADQPMITEDTKTGSVVAQLVVQDPDQHEEMSILLSSSVIDVGSMSCLPLTKGSRCVGDVTLSRQLNYEEKMTWSVDVTAVDGGGLKIEKNFSIQVGDKNDPPQVVKLNCRIWDLLINGKAVNTVSVPENSKDVTIATLGAVDPDKKQKHSFSVQGSNLFDIAGDKLQVMSAAVLNYEQTKEYKIKVKVTDTGTPPLTLEKEVTIHVTDVNEVPTDVRLSISQVREDSGAGTVVGQLVTTDPDNAVSVRQSHTYRLTDDAQGRFDIKGDSLIVKKAAFDYETSRTHSIVVEVTDSGKKPLKAAFTLTIEVLDANDPPTNLRLNVTTIRENTAVGTVVGHVTADDVDKAQSLRYTLGDTSHFVISGQQLIVDGTLDFETSPYITFRVLVTDTGLPPKSLNQSFKVDITDVNEVPGVTKLKSTLPKGSMKIPESVGVGEVIAHLKTFDPDKVDFVAINVTSRSDPRLRLDAKGPSCQQKGRRGTLCTVHVQLATALNYEERKDDIHLEVQTRDKGGLGRTEGWTFTVADSNDKPTAISIAGNRTEIPENQRSYKLGKLQCSDPDPGDAHFFQLLTQWDLFHVARGGILTVKRRLNYEQHRSYDVMVRCTDNGRPRMFVTQKMTFLVKNVNEKPTDIILSQTEVPMSAQKNSTVSFLQVKDPDNEGQVKVKQKHMCRLQEGQDVFYIDVTRNALKVKEKIPAQRHAVPITVNCSDDGQPPLSLSKQFQMRIVETAAVPKEVRVTGTRTVPENSPGTVLGNLTVVNLLTDAPVLGNYTCTDLKVKETNDTVLAIEGKNLVTKQPLDFETQPTLTATLTCSGLDTKGRQFTAKGEITVKVVDVNEAPTAIRTYGGGKVEENSGQGTVITQLNTVDPESDQNYTYNLMAVAAGLNISAADPNLLNAFAVKGRSLIVGPKATLLNHETTPIFSLLLQSTDNGQPPLSVNDTVIVEVLDANDPPTAIVLNNTKVSENSAVDTVVGHLTVTDEDKGQNHTCHVTNLKDVPFTIKNGLDLVVSSGDIDYEKAKTHVVKVTCQDAGKDGSHLRVSASLTVNVSDVNEAPYDVRLSKASVAENSPAGQVIGEVMATDPDSKKVNFTIEKGGKHFRITGDSTLTAQSSFNYEEVASLPVTIRATDNQGLSTVKRFRVQIEDKNDPPSNLSLSNHVVSESTPPSGQVALLTTEDPDRGQTFTFHLNPDPTVDGHLAISGNKLVVGKKGVDYESSSSYRVKITAVDSGAPSLNITKEFNITVTNVNEAPTDIVTESLSPIPENVTVPHVLTTIKVIDQEVGQRHSCHLIGSHGPLSVVTRQNGTMTLAVISRLDYETAQRYDVTLSCSDGMYDVKKNLTVMVTDINEAPSQVKLSGPQVVPTSVKGEQGVGTLTVTDQDNAQSHTLVLRGPNSDLFAIHSGKELVLTKPIPAAILSSPTPQVTFTVTATDSGHPPLTLKQTFTLPVTEVDLKDLRLPRIVLGNSHVQEDDVKGTVVGALYNLNITLSDAVVFVLLKDEERLFKIKDNRMLVLSRNMSSFTGRSANVTIQARNKRTGETVERTITVLVKRSDKCYKDGRTCDKNARCVPKSAEESECKCSADYRGDGYSCKQINDCITKDGHSPCVRGKCVDGVGKFQCACPPGYNGSRCEIEANKQDPCHPNPCGQGSASCLPHPSNTSSFTCPCKPGWEGPRCNRSQDDCVRAGCRGANSTCLDRHLTYLCRCDPLRKGPRCEYLKKACANNPCKTRRVCVPMPDSDKHTCVPPAVSVSFLLLCRRSGVSDMEVCRVRFMDFARIHGRFPKRAAKSSAASPASSRYRRASASTSGAQYTPGVHVYLVKWKEKEGRGLTVTVVVMDAGRVVYSKGEVLKALQQTCQSIKVEGLQKTAFCPAIEKEAERYGGGTKPGGKGDGKGKGKGKGDGKGGGEGGGLPLPIIAGGAGGALVVIIIIIVVVVILKRRKSKADNDQQSHALASSSIEVGDSQDDSGKAETSMSL